MNLKKRNVVLQAAVACAVIAMAGSANAGTSTATAITYATQNFQATTVANAAVQNAITIQPNALTYSMSAATTVNTAGIIYFQVRLTGGTFGGTAPVAADFNVAAQGAGSNLSAIVLSTDKKTVQVKFTATADTFLGLGALVYTPAAGTIVKVNDALAAAGGVVSAESTITTTAGTATTLQSTVALSSVDGAIPSSTLAKSASAISAAVSAAAGAGQIDLTASPPASAYFTSGATLQTAGASLGSVTLTETTGNQMALDGATDYTLAAGSDHASTATDTTITVTPPAGTPFPVGATVDASTTAATATVPACAAANLLGLGPAVFTAVTAATAATLVVPWANMPGSGSPTFVCLTAPSATDTATPITPTIAASLTPGVAADAPTTVAATTGYALDYNGSKVDVRNYVPFAVTGYQQFLRIINTGTVAAKVSAAVINETTGVVGTAGVLITSLAAGAAMTLDATAIEAAIGAQAATARPRVRITAPTNGMNVQNYLFTPSGSFTEASGAQ